MSSTAPVTDEKQNGPRSRKGVETRARLLDAAEQIFEEHGFFDARISDIAERAQLSHGSFYHYFDSKEQVFREVAEKVDEQLSRPLGSVIFDAASSKTPEARIREAMRLHLESYRAVAKIMGVIEQVSRYDDQVKASRAARHRVINEEIADSIRRLQRRGLADPELDPTIAVAALGAMTSRFPELWLTEGDLECSFDAGVEQLTRLFLNALQLREAPGRVSRS